jgi:hypothetical protein
MDDQPLDGVEIREDEKMTKDEYEEIWNSQYE